MNVVDAAHAVVHDYPGGSIALAPRLGMSAAILRGKVNPSDIGHHLTITESVRMQAMTCDHRILSAEADELGYMLTRIPQVASGDIGMAAMRAIKEFGDFVGSVEESLRDGKVTTNELRRIEKELLEAEAHIRILHQLVVARTGKK
ncbi:MAG: phage regulatory CII family protein [Gammaproteobacteria bacterium]|nr:phage regulatory CII family protein [Gammaproteobacteria bacterium]MBU1647445.1 phage regulatory CII family protein [Gammaproteobacteria bacterium]MBU1973237.1 phage regulatory CII family protein [Gammaproteobacteria bacterium]